MKTIEEAIVAASSILQAVGIENPRMESEFLIAAFLQVPRTQLILDRHLNLAAEKIDGFQEWLSEREKRKPLAYVCGEQPFRDLRLTVTTSVLIPRPETELLVEQALRVLDRVEREAVAIDVGTGSGAIALSLAKHSKVKQVIGIDVSSAALQVARGNGKRILRGAAVEWLQGNLLEPVQKRRIKADVIVANLPYVCSRDMNLLEPELHWEPRLALDGGPEGLDFIKPCIAQAADVLVPGGTLLLEIGSEQSADVVALFEGSALWTGTRVFRDLAGLPRIIQSQRKELPWMS